MKVRWAAVIGVVLCAASPPTFAQQPVQAVLGPPTLTSALPTSQQPAPAILEVQGEVSAPSQEGQTVEVLEPENEIKPVVRLIGRLNIDAILVNQSARNQQLFGTVQNAVGFRRARLGAEGEVGGNVYWQAEFDFAGGNIAFRNVFVGLKDLPVVRRIQVGHMCEPFSLEGAESENFLPFVERSPIYELDPQRNWAVLALSYTDDERGDVSISVSFAREPATAPATTSATSTTWPTTCASPDWPWYAWLVGST